MTALLTLAAITADLVAVIMVLKPTHKLTPAYVYGVSK